MSVAAEPWRLGVADLAAAFGAGDLDPETLLDALLDRIARRDPALNTLVAIDAQGARAAARDSAARWRAGAPRSAIDGVPLTVKDNLLMAGLPATWGSRAYAGFLPAEDEAPVARLRAAGAVLLGKTNVPELTLEGYTSNLLFGTTRNPWDPALTPGGSSGGAAAGVAAGFVPAAIGTDGGGSIRRPAAHTGLVGFKPSIGRIPRAGGFPETLHDFEVIGTLTRSVGDAALLDAVLSGEAAPAPAPRPMRILHVPRFGDAPLDPEVAAACEAAAGALAAAGHTVDTGPVFFDRAAVDEIWRVVGRAGVARVARLTGGRLLAEGGPTIRAMAEEGARLSGADYADAMSALAAFRRAVAQLFDRHDLVFMPSAAALPWRAEEAYPATIDGQIVGPRGHAIYTGWVNAAGLPAMALPLAPSRAGLPIGGQFVAAAGRDADLLAFAASVAPRLATPSWPAFAEA
ncbi:amidase [Lichenibacterium ramalinae]|uniref:Indoleacetamide hydrolase n=1 Tax=Lichenibacterium ramalinae TaxID=2316527 RepID=A0A4Q2RIW7_9HYPH|nr:amidase [Lichenibacterium ramalinae]RYB06810.1 amidase [Lichenibacterium ramalinae]